MFPSAFIVTVVDYESVFIIIVTYNIHVTAMGLWDLHKNELPINPTEKFRLKSLTRVHA